MIQSKGVSIQGAEGDQFFTKFLGFRQNHNPSPGKVTIASIFRTNGLNGPLGVSFLWNDGSPEYDAAIRGDTPWEQVPNHLKLTRDGQDFFGF